MVTDIGRKRDIGINLLLDIDGAVGEAYRIGALPLAVFIDRGGLITKKVIGPLSANILQSIFTNLGA